ncbi:hypothetical protein HY643_03935, partial [Candidatus Woesearchaeota archaeon]|nr:hypothetical protein [Candidatus Woesearchaeota archaeon]
TVLYNANNIALIAEEINGDLHLAYAQSCVAEIQNYKGTRFGQGMKNCKIYSPNPETLETIKKQIVNGKNNKFIIGTMPEESKKWA